MTHLAIANIGRKHHCREVGNALLESNEPIWGAGHNTRQARSHVNLMDQNLKIDAVAGIRVDCIHAVAAGVVADDAQGDQTSGTSVRTERVMAAVTTGGGDHIMCVGDCAAIQYKREYVIGEVGA